MLFPKKTVAIVPRMSAFCAEPVVSGLKTDIGALRSAIGGKADVTMSSGDFRF